MTAVQNAVIDKLRKLINDNNWKQDFLDGIKKAQTYDIDDSTIKDISTAGDSLEGYYDWLLKHMNWIPSENTKSTAVLTAILDHYFILMQPTILSKQNKIEPNSGPNTPFSQWMVDFVQEIGKFMDSYESINEETIHSFHKSEKYQMHYYAPPPSGFRTFNQFFARHTRPGMRPIADMHDRSVIVNVGDSTFGEVIPVDNNSEVLIKGLKWTIKELLADSVYADAFKGGILTHSFLAVTDYHRLHVPLEGRVLEAKVVPGRVYLEVIVDNQDRKTVLRANRAMDDRFRISSTMKGTDVPDTPGYQFAQARGFIVLETAFGPVMVMANGMAQISSVVLTAEKGVYLQKGEEFGYFQMGGSDFMMLFPANMIVALEVAAKEHRLQGARIGKILQYR